MENSEIVKESKSILKGNYGKVILPYLIVFLISNFLSNNDLYENLYNNYGIEYALIFFTIAILVIPSLYVGLASYSLSISNDSFDSNKLFDGFSIFSKSATIGIIYFLVVVVGFVLFIIPGIYVSLLFSQVFYIVSENNDVNIKDAFKKSATIMKGNMWKFFKLGLRYAFYFILSIFTLFIWALWLIPQMYVSYAIFFKEINH